MAASARAEQVIWVEVPIKNSESVFHGRDHEHYYRLPLHTDEAASLYEQLRIALFG